MYLLRSFIILFFYFNLIKKKVCAYGNRLYSYLESCIANNFAMEYIKANIPT